ncbi:hypothetical protein pb186bvf_007830 [Paramecium bursaria]
MINHNSICFEDKVLFQRKLKFMRKIFELNEKSRKKCIIVIIIQIVLTITSQIIGWFVQKSYDVYTYKSCTYKLSGATVCSGYSSDQGDTYSDYGCPGPTTIDCRIGQQIRDLYLAGLIMPLVWYGIIAASSLFLILCFNHKYIKLKILFISLIFCDLICIIFYFCDVSMINNQNNLILFSQQTFGVCIALGILYIFQMICKIYLNIFIFQYLSQLQLKEKIPNPNQFPNPNTGQPNQHLVTNPNTIRDVYQYPNQFQQPQQQPQQQQQNQISEEEAALNQVIWLSLQEKQHNDALKKKQEENELLRVLQEEQEQLKKKQEEEEEIKLIERLKVEEEQEQIRKAIQQSMQQKQQYLPD